MKYTRHTSAFSLVEVAIILVVISIIGGLTLGLAPSDESRDAEQLTQRNLENIEAAILAFYNENGFLPCPATLNGTAANIGVATDCSVPNVTGQVLEVDADPNRMRVGAIPIRALDLSPRDMIDGWNNRIMYAVPTELAINTTRYDAYTNTLNAIQVIDRNGTTIDSGNVAFVLYAPGQNRKGAFTAQGRASTAAILACGAAGNDAESCDGDDIFRKSFFDSAAATLYDDFFLHTTLDRVAEFGNYTDGGGGVTDNYYSLFREGTTIGAGEPKNATWNILSFPTTVTNGAGITPTTSGVAPDQTTSFLVPAGQYLVRVNVQACGIDNNFILFWIGSDVGGGIPHDQVSGTAPTYCGRTVASTYLNFTAATNLTIYNYSAVTNATDGHGRDSALGWAQAYRDVEFWKLD